MKIINNLYKIFLFNYISFLIIITGLYLYAFLSPKITLNSANSVYLYDYADNLIFESNNHNKWTKIDEINPNVINATIAIEDKSFYNHHGFDYLRIIKALYLNITNKSIIQGASTISQQYVKNLYLDFDKTWKRKIEEAFLTIKLEAHYNKDEILEGYLNTINYGQGNYGIGNASEYYFNKKATDLSLEEATMLAGIPRSPENNNPIGNYNNCLKRAKLVAEAMLKNKYITLEDFNNLDYSSIKLYGKRKTNNLQTLMYYHDAVIDELNNLKEIPKSLIESGGLKIYTSYNPEVQKYLDEAIIKNSEEKSNVQIASIITNPSTGGIMALAGGRNYSQSEYNRAIKANRQVGSTIKPFLYYTALENNMTEASTFLSEQTTFVFSNNQTYSPKNHSNTYGNKEISMVAALAYSDNIYAVKTHLFLGEEQLVNTLKKVGIKTQIKPNPSLALGAYEINMLDYTQGYNTLANYGIKKRVHFINKVEDSKGNILYKIKDYDEKTLNKESVFIINEMLTNTYNSTFRDYLNPTVIYLNSKISRKYALKSGTTENDYWLVGYNPDILMIVWAGNDMNENVESSYSKRVKNIWVETVESYEKDKKVSWYEMPDNIVGVPLDPVTAQKNSKKSIIYYFKKGTEPK